MDKAYLMASFLGFRAFRNFPAYSLKLKAEPGLEDPAFGVELPGMPGKVPQGELLGVVVLGVVLGSIGDGCVLLPGVGVGDVEPGAVVVGGGVVGVAELPEGVTGVPTGVAVLPGGVAVPGV